MIALLGCPSAPETAEERVFAVASGGRLVLVPSDLEGLASIVLHLAVEDEGAAPTRTARVVAPDGRRLDTRIDRVPGAGQVFRLELGARFLRPGGYLIEVDGQGSHALNLRRYVVVVAGDHEGPPEP